MNYPIRIFSDLHLGHSASTIKEVEQLRPLITGAGTVIFNGDTWQELALEVKDESAEMLARLKELCAEEGVEAVFLPGNHDPNVSKQNYVSLNGGEIVIFHGDVIFPEVSPWSQYYLERRKTVQALISEKLKPGQPLDERFALAKEVVKVMHPGRKRKKVSRMEHYLSLVWPPRRLWTLLNVKRMAKRKVQKFCEEYFPEARVVIYGHFHISQSFLTTKTVFINTGAFMEGCRAQFVEIQEKEMYIQAVCYSDNSTFEGGQITLIR